MNTLKFSRFASSALVLLSLLTISASQAQTITNLALAVSFWYPTNGQTFTAPANIGLPICIECLGPPESPHHFRQSGADYHQSGVSRQLLVSDERPDLHRASQHRPSCPSG